MSPRDLQVDAVEISDGLTVEDMKRIFGLEPPAIDTPERRLKAWSEACQGSNMITIGSVSYSWDTRPRRQKNGAVIGRIYAQAAGELTRDVGSYKIDARGRVLNLPEILRAALPGGLEASPDLDNGETS